MDARPMSPYIASMPTIGNAHAAAPAQERYQKAHNCCHSVALLEHDRLVRRFRVREAHCKLSAKLQLVRRQWCCLWAEHFRKGEAVDPCSTKVLVITSRALRSLGDGVPVGTVQGVAAIVTGSTF
jgi:hypothetical protein